MWIRSQDKKTIFDISGCTLGVNFENKICGLGNNSSDEDTPVLLGSYPTEERAIEVLDEICNFYLNLNRETGNEIVSTNIGFGYFGGYVKNGVFQMPEV